MRLVGFQGVAPAGEAADVLCACACVGCCRVRGRRGMNKLLVARAASHRDGMKHGFEAQAAHLEAGLLACHRLVGARRRVDTSLFGRRDIRTGVVSFRSESMRRVHNIRIAQPSIGAVKHSWCEPFACGLRDAFDRGLAQGVKRCPGCQALPRVRSVAQGARPCPGLPQGAKRCRRVPSCLSPQPLCPP